MLIDMTSNELNLIDTALATHALAYETERTFCDETRVKIGKRLTQWRTGVDVESLKLMLGANVLTREECVTICQRAGIPPRDVIEQKPITEIDTKRH